MGIMGLSQNYFYRILHRDPMAHNPYEIPIVPRVRERPVVETPRCTKCVGMRRINLSNPKSPSTS